jgi:hypothetical protein
LTLIRPKIDDLARIQDLTRVAVECWYFSRGGRTLLYDFHTGRPGAVVLAHLVTKFAGHTNSDGIDYTWSTTIKPKLIKRR